MLEIRIIYHQHVWEIGPPSSGLPLILFMASVDEVHPLVKLILSMFYDYAFGETLLQHPVNVRM